jgi:hypothetical protein
MNIEKEKRTHMDVSKTPKTKRRNGRAPLTNLAFDQILGTATIFVSLVITWKDQRLQWDVNDNDTCTNSVNAWTGQVSHYLING